MFHKLLTVPSYIIIAIPFIIITISSKQFFLFLKQYSKACHELYCSAVVRDYFFLLFFAFISSSKLLARDFIFYSAGCDLYHGNWFYDTSGPLYTNNTCPVLTQTQNCQGNGRPDKDYENWRWKPFQCELPRFDARKFLELMKGKTLAFIGDSVGRNQMESMLCILWQAMTYLCSVKLDILLII